jgi:hypothetical protein
VRHLHTISFHYWSTTPVLVPMRPLTLPDTIIVEMISEISGPKVPFADLSLGPKVLFLPTRVPDGLQMTEIVPLGAPCGASGRQEWPPDVHPCRNLR